MMLIVLCGYSKSGKDEIAKHLPGVRLAFADAMKELYCVAAGITMAELEANKELHRPKLVEFGRKGRELCPSMWIEPVHYALQRLYPDAEPGDAGIASDEAREAVEAKITDARYRNECTWSWGWGGKVFYVSRSGVGPANDEERDSIAELRRVLAPPVIHNDRSPEVAAATILEMVKGSVKV